MLQKILNLEGVELLKNSDLKLLVGGWTNTLTCTFSDGESWQGSVEFGNDGLTQMALHCDSQGGSIQITTSR